MTIYNKKKTYVRPETEAMFMEQDDLLVATVTAENEGWGGGSEPVEAKKNSLSSLLVYDETWGAEDEAGEVWGDCWQ